MPQPDNPARDETADRPNLVSVDPPVARLDTNLYGRSALQQGILRGEFLLPDKSPAKVHILHGLGGSGKTHLALSIADVAQKAGKNVWWVSVPQLSASMREVATRLSAPDKDVDRAWAGVSSANDLVWRWLNQSRKPWVLIFDNADDATVLGPSGGKVADGTGWLRTPSNDGVVLVTTREGNDAVWGAWCCVHTVNPLDDVTGGQLLLNRASRAGSEYDAQALSAALGGLPLALRAAGDYLRSVHETKVFQGASAIRTFDGYHNELIRRRTPAASGQLTGMNTLTEILGQQVVEEVFTISLNLLSLRGLTQAAALVRTLAFFDTVPLPYSAVLDSNVLAWSPVFADEPAQQILSVLEGLANLALISTEIEGPRDNAYSYLLSLHPLVRAIARNDQATRANWVDYQQLALDLLLNATSSISPDEPEDWSAWHVLEPHATEVSVSCLTAPDAISSMPTTRAALELARRSARYLIANRLLPPSVENNLRNMIGASARLGFAEDSVEVLALRHELARVSLERLDFADAAAQLTPIIADRTRVLGAINADTLASRHKLGRAIMGMEQWSLAEAEFREILEGEAQLSLARPYDTNVVRHSLARTIRFQGGRAAEAEAHVRQAIAELLAIRPANHPEILFAQDTLAQCLAEQQRYAEAKDVLDASLNAVGTREESWEQVTWLRRTQRIVDVFLNVDHERNSDPGAAVEALQHHVDDLRKRFGDGHPETVRALEVLSRLESPI